VKPLTPLILLILVFGFFLFLGCESVEETSPADEAPVEEPIEDEPESDALQYDDGRYRGVYQDRGEEQVGVQFDIENGLFSAITFRSLAYDGVDYLGIEEGSPAYGLTEQHQQAIDYLIGKPVEAIFDLYSPGDFVDDVDGFTGATIRANKIFSAIMNGLQRGVYSY